MTRCQNKNSSFMLTAISQALARHLQIHQCANNLRQSGKTHAVYESAGIVQALEIFYCASITNRKS